MKQYGSNGRIKQRKNGKKEFRPNLTGEKLPKLRRKLDGRRSKIRLNKVITIGVYYYEY